MAQTSPSPHRVSIRFPKPKPWLNLATFGLGLGLVIVGFIALSAAIACDKGSQPVSQIFGYTTLAAIFIAFGIGVAVEKIDDWPWF